MWVSKKQSQMAGMDLWALFAKAYGLSDHDINNVPFGATKYWARNKVNDIPGQHHRPVETFVCHPYHAGNKQFMENKYFLKLVTIITPEKELQYVQNGRCV